MYNLSDNEIEKIIHSSFSHIPIFNKKNTLAEFIKDKFSNLSSNSIVDNVPDGTFLYSDDLLKVSVYYIDYQQKSNSIRLNHP